MEEKRVSVVVPVYNVRDYLEECLESIRNQTYRNLEILLIDDGSTDGSSELCDTYAEKDWRIQVLHQENAGLAKTRKRGILEATAELLCFVDSDDTVDLEMIEYFVRNIGEADLLTSGCCREEANGSCTQRYDAFAEGLYCSKEEMDDIFRNMMMYHGRMEDGILPYRWNKLYRTELLQEVVQGADERITCDEDRELVLRYVLHCHSIVITKEIFYHYRYRNTSLIHKSNDFYLHDLCYFYNSLKSIFEAHALRDSLMGQLEKFVASRMILTTQCMGFSLATRCIRYIFPFYNQLDGKRIVLYGAGVVGNDYYRQIQAEGDCQLVLWVDKSWQKIQETDRKVEAVEHISGTVFDAVIIAVKKELMAQEIRRELEEMGVASQQILWKAPLEILNV